MEIKYKAVYIKYGIKIEQGFNNLQCAFECAKRNNGIVLHNKEARR